MTYDNALMSKSKMDANEPKESTPLLSSSSSSTQAFASAKKDWTKLRIATDSVIGFRRGDVETSKTCIEPAQALAPLVTGGFIKTTDGTILVQPRPEPMPKSSPPFHPDPRTARHKSKALNDLNEFRHQYKNTRLALKIGGMAIYAKYMWSKMISYSPVHHKSLRHMQKTIKKLGQGGSMKVLLRWLHPFTNTLRISMVIWRTIEAAKLCRLEVGAEETMGYIGNRLSHQVAKHSVDYLVATAVLPGSYYIFSHNVLPMELWFPAFLCIFMGILRAVSPYALSFQGSRLGRVLARQFFMNFYHRWQPIQTVEHFKSECGDYPYHVPQLADTAAKAICKAQEEGFENDVKGRQEIFAQQGFQLVGFGSGGYSVYVCNAVTSSSDDKSSANGQNAQVVLLHVTPYGPSLMDTLPHYIVFETADSRDCRAAWNDMIATCSWEKSVRSSVLEGYAYRGAFFSPSQYAQLKDAYDHVLANYNRACSALPDPSKEEKNFPPTDEKNLKKFLNTGLVKKEHKRKMQEKQKTQEYVEQVTKRLQSKMKSKNGCSAPQGVIVYIEGLSCARKSSTAGLIQQALNDAGYEISVQHYNRPPTQEEKTQPWMNRFQVPCTSTTLEDGGESGEMGGTDNNKTKGGCAEHDHTAVVWERGPAGDFVFGSLANAPESEKKDCYREFMEFDRECFQNNILFIKLMFFTNQEAIADTLGTRLGNQKVVQDIHTWLTASYGNEKADEIMKGMDTMKDVYINPTDFASFNSYLSTLPKFTNFALNTDSNYNPWIVVNTANHFLACERLLQVFSAQLDAYSLVKHHETSCPSWWGALCCPKAALMPAEECDAFGVEFTRGVEKVKRRMHMVAVIALSGILIYLYLFWLK